METKINIRMFGPKLILLIHEFIDLFIPWSAVSKKRAKRAVHLIYVFFVFNHSGMHLVCCESDSNPNDE